MYSADVSSVGVSAAPWPRTLVFDALEQALYSRQPASSDALVNRSDRGSQYASIRYTERLVEAAIQIVALNN